MPTVRIPAPRHNMEPQPPMEANNSSQQEM